MGKGMGTNLLKHKFPLTVFDKFPTNTEFLKPLGAMVAPSLEVLANSSDVVVSMVQNDEQVKQVVRDVIAAAKHPGKLFVDCSTVSPDTSKAMLSFCREHGHEFLDAPVSGGVNGAMNGTLTLMVGAGSHELFIRARPVLEALGTPVHCGAVGAGAAVKLANNLMLAINMVSAAEGFRLAQKLGVDLEVFNKVVNASSAQSWVTTKYNPVPGIIPGVPASREYKNGFTIDLMLKDLGLALELAKGDAQVAEFCQHVYMRAREELGGDLDFGAVFNLGNKK